MKAALFALLGLSAGVLAGIDADRQIWPEVPPFILSHGGSVHGPLVVASRFGCTVSFGADGGIWPADDGVPERDGMEVILCSPGGAGMQFGN